MNAIGHPLTDDPDHYLPPSPFNLWMAVSLKNEGSQLSWDPPAKVCAADDVCHAYMYLHACILELHVFAATQCTNLAYCSAAYYMF